MFLVHSLRRHDWLPWIYLPCRITVNLSDKHYYIDYNYEKPFFFSLYTCCICRFIGILPVFLRLLRISFVALFLKRPHLCLLYKSHADIYISKKHKSEKIRSCLDLCFHLANISYFDFRPSCFLCFFPSTIFHFR